MTEPLLSIQGLVKNYGSHRVLDGVDLDLAPHDVVCLIGPSGCGKSTLLRCANGLESIDHGRIQLDHEYISGPAPDLDSIRKRVGIVFQSYNLFPHLTVQRNLTLAPRKVLGLPKRVAERRASELLARVGLQDMAHRYPDQLSGGQQQRVAIARSLAMGPQVLLLDEVTSALDPELVNEVLLLIRELALEGMTMMIATHEMAFARDVADKVVFIADGRVVESGPPSEVLESPTHPRTQNFLARTLNRAI